MKTTQTLLKICIGLAIGCIIYYQLMIKNDFQWDDLDMSITINSGRVHLLIFAVFLMPLNWFIEAKKWHYLMWKSTDIDISLAIKNVLRGISFGIISPQRLGEYYGRMLALPSLEQRYDSAAATLMTSIAQNTCNVGFGLFFIQDILLDRMMPGDYSLDNSNYLYGLTCLAVLLYFNLNHLVKLFVKLPLRFVKRIFKSLNHVNFWDKAYVLLLSACRYMVYTTQFVLILMFFGAEVNRFLLMGGISVIYLIQSGIPLPGGFALIARGSIALFVLTKLGVGEGIIIGATMGIWVINLVIPAFFGWILLRKVDLLFKK